MTQMYINQATLSMPSLIPPLLLLVSLSSTAQVFSTSTGVAGFNKKMPVENIKAINRAISVELITDKNEVTVRIPISEFEFSNRLMQSNFNNDYLESQKFPMAVFTGSLSENVNFKIADEYPVTIKGSLLLHGIRKNIELKGIVNIDKEQIVFDGGFPIRLEDFKIDPPRLGFEKISVINVNTHFELKIEQ